MRLRYGIVRLLTLDKNDEGRGESGVSAIRAVGNTKAKALAVLALLVAPVLLVPALASAREGGSASISLNGRPIGGFTPAVSDPRLAGLLARSSSRPAAFRFTPASAARDSNRSIRVAIRARGNNPLEAARQAVSSTSAQPTSAITPSSYSLGVSLGWRRFAVSGDVAQADGGALPGRREDANVGVSYRAAPRLTGRVAVAAERSDGAQRLVRDDEAYSLDVGGAYSIARNVDVTAGARYRIARDRIEAMQRDERRDSQAVYVGTAFRF